MKLKTNKNKKKTNNFSIVRPLPVDNPMASRRFISFQMGGTVRTINLQRIVYAVYTVGSGASYSISNSALVTSYDVLGSVFADQEFTLLADQYTAYNISSYSVSYSSSVVPGTTAVVSLPPFFGATNYGYTGSFDPLSLAKSDAAIEFKVNNAGFGKQTITYGLPPVMVGANGYAMFGSYLYLSTVSPIASGNLTFQIGWLQTPQFASTATTQYVPVGVLDFLVKVYFVQPVLE